MSILSDKVAAYVKADNDVTTLESQQNELAKSIAAARKARDESRRLVQEEFLQNGDMILTIPLDEGSAVTLIRNPQATWVDIHVAPLDTEASFVSVAVASMVKSTISTTG